MPTLAELCGIDVDEEEIDGRSIAAAVRRGEEPEEVPVFAEISSWEAIQGKTQGQEELAAHVMVRDGRWKYLWNRTDIDELYDLESDPDEMANLAGDSDQQHRVLELLRQIREMLQRTGPGPYEWFAASA